MFSKMEKIIILPNKDPLFDHYVVTDQLDDFLGKVAEKKDIFEKNNN